MDRVRTLTARDGRGRDAAWRRMRAAVHGPRFQPSGAASTGAPSEAPQSPFGGKPAVDIPPQAKAMGAFLQAEVATEEGDRTEALKALEEAVQYDPGNATLRITLATLYVRDGRLADARVQADQAMKLDPGSSRALLLAAGIDSALGDDPSAEQDYKEVIRISPKNQEAYLFLGTLYAKRGDYEQARKVFEQLIALDPQSFLGYYYAGRTMLAAGNYRAAERYYNKALDLNPQSELALLDLAALREDQGRRDDAVAIYKKILQINPNDDRAHKRLAELYFAAHASAEAPVKPAPALEKDRDQSERHPHQDWVAVLRARRLRPRGHRVQPGAWRRARQLPRPLLSRHRLQRTGRLRQGGDGVREDSRGQRALRRIAPAARLHLRQAA